MRGQLLPALALVATVQAQMTLDGDGKPASSLSETSAPSQWPSISGDARFVVFQRLAADVEISDVAKDWDIYIHDRTTNSTAKIADARDEPLIHPAISADGRVVAYLEARRDVAPDADSFRRRAWWVVIHDREINETRAIAKSVLCDRVYWPRWSPPISSDGRHVAFISPGDTGCLQAYVFDRETGTRELVSVGSNGHVSELDVDYVGLSASGRFAVFTSASMLLATPRHSDPFDYANDRRHVFVRDRHAKTGEYASDRALKQLGYSDYVEPLVSDDGRFVAYNHCDSRRMGCGHVGFVSDLVEDKAGRLLPTAADWWQGTVWITSMTPDARFVVVESSRHDLVHYDASHRYQQVFLLERESQHWRLVSARPDGKPANGLCARGAISANGRFVAFESEAGDIVAGDSNMVSDIFVRDLVTGSIARVSAASESAAPPK